MPRNTTQIVNVNEMTFGIEIECSIPTAALIANNIQIGEYHRGRQINGLPEGWNSQRDGSIRPHNYDYTAIEIVSPVLKGEDGARQIQQVAAKLHEWGAKVNSSCGFHVHVGWTWGVKALAKLVSLTANFETALFATTGTLSRQTSHFCKPIKQNFRSLQFNVTDFNEIGRMARTLAEMPQLAVVDEFTSVVDRTVAKIGSAAIQKAIRRRGQQLVAVTCHYDVLDWLEPDWVYEPHTGKLARGRLRRRPAIELVIERTTTEAWSLFEPHHYLSRDLHKSARCFVAYFEGKPAAFCAVLHFPHHIRPGWRETRTVCLPDFQGVGIGNVLSNYVASVFRATGKPYRDTTGHPGHVHYRIKSPLWKCTRESGLTGRTRTKNRVCKQMATTNARDRLTYSFEYIGPSRPDDARQFGLPVPARREHNHV